MTLILAGEMVGLVIGLPLSGFLAEQYGWDVVFYVCGSFGVVWFVFWFLLCHSSPTSHPRISQV